MVYLTVKEESADKLHLIRTPSVFSWFMCIGVSVGGMNMAYGIEGLTLGKLIFAAGEVLFGLFLLEFWEDCVFNKVSGEVRYKTQRVWSKILTPFTETQGDIVCHLREIVEVRVMQVVDFGGPFFSVELKLSTGYTASFTRINTSEHPRTHYEIAEKIREFIGLKNEVRMVSEFD